MPTAVQYCRLWGGWGMIPIRNAGSGQMARRPWEIEINENTTQADLELCANADQRSSDPNNQRVAAQARAELTRRERQFQIEIFNAQETARVKAQQFQAAQAERAEEAMENSNDVDPRNVMVVYGRDEALRTSMFEFLRSLGLNPIEWEQAVNATGSTSPHTLDVVVKAFEMARGVVVLMAGDDLAKLRPDLVSNDDQGENELLPQPRANVLFEAGMALALHRDRTVPVSIGNIRRMSNIDGINLVRLDNSPEARNTLAQRLENAGCPVSRDGKDWLTTGNFEAPIAAQDGLEDDENQEPAHDLSEEEISILKALYENAGIPENALAGVAGLGEGQVNLWIRELLDKKIIHQTRAGSARGENEFSISPGQVGMLRRIGVM